MAPGVYSSPFTRTRSHMGASSAEGNNTPSPQPNMTPRTPLSLWEATSLSPLFRVLHIPVLSPSSVLSASRLAMSTGSGMDGFTDVTYNHAADTFLQQVELAMDNLNDPMVEEVQYSDGVLTVDTPSHGSFVLNKQAAKCQLWLSSPISGPHHYDMVKQEPTPGRDLKETQEVVHWLCERDQHDLQKRLEDELGIILKRRITF